MPYINRLEYIKNKYGFKIKEVGIDSGYDTLDIKKYLHDNEIFGVIAYRRYAKSETTVRKNRFKYIKESDCYICPETKEKKKEKKRKLRCRNRSNIRIYRKN